MRLLPALIVSASLILAACSDNTYRRTMAGAGAGAAVGAAGGALCCHDPVDNIGPGILIGAAVGAAVGYLLSTVD